MRLWWCLAAKSWDATRLWPNFAGDDASQIPRTDLRGSCPDGGEGLLEAELAD